MNRQEKQKFDCDECKHIGSTMCEICSRTKRDMFELFEEVYDDNES